MRVKFCFIGLIILVQTVHGYAAAVPVHGAYSHWSKFSECSETCGGGKKIRKRSCNNPAPKNGGMNCSSLGPAMESEACNSFPCPIDGGYSEWSNFTECSVTCGGGFQRRTRTCTNPLPCCGGKNCEDLGPSLETQECGTCTCVVDGGWSEWCSFTVCSVTCGGGVRYRNRTCTNPPPEGGGQDCQGPYTESQECNTNSCHNGNYTEWTEWSSCSVTCGIGTQKRTRTCTNPPPGQGGSNCVELSLGPSAETHKCSPTPCPIDGNYTEYTEWSDCSATCGGGSQTRSRKCTNPPPQYGGENCVELAMGPANETRKCNPDPCPIDGNYTEWTEWSDCSVTCGGGSQTRSRKCTNPSPKYGGENCVELAMGPTNETQGCKTVPCPIDGNYTEWSEWSDCSVTCGGGNQSRSRTCTNPHPKHGGKNCDNLGPADETQECNPEPCPIDGNYTEWTEWSDCDFTCGGGIQSRSRNCSNPPPQYGGMDCEDLGPAGQVQECNTDPCPIDGNYTEWSEWSDCSVTCGGGNQSRLRTCTNPHPKHDGKNCDKLGPADETQGCNQAHCPIDGDYTEWSEWSECSATCGGGIQTKGRQCTNPSPQYGGIDCEELGAANATRECNTNTCPPPCSAGLDIGIVLDKSKSVRYPNLKKVIASLVELVDKFEPAPDKDHFGLITFNRQAVTEFTFSDKTLYSKESLKQRIQHIPLTLELQTRTDLAMEAARDSLFSPSGGDRPGKPNVMIMLTDGKPTNQRRDFTEFADDFHKDPKVANLYIVAVGIGSGINEKTLHEIAGENGNVMTVESFNQLANELGEIKDKVCA